MAWLVATVAVNASDIGDTVEAKININSRMQVTPEVKTPVMSIQLDGGTNGATWEVTASLNCFVRGINGRTVYAAGAVSRYVPTMTEGDGETAFVGSTIWNGRADPVVPSVGRPIVINTPPGTTRPVYLMLWVHETADDIWGVWVYGFMHARRTR